MRLFLFVLASFLIFTAPPLRAGDGIVECGMPEDVGVEPGEHEFCDIYSRQLAYPEKRNKLVADIKARQEKFAAPAIQARKNHEAALQEYYGWGMPETEDDGAMIENGENRIFE